MSHDVHKLNNMAFLGMCVCEDMPTIGTQGWCGVVNKHAGGSDRSLSSRIQTHIVDHEMHDALWHEIAHGLVDDGHVGVHQVPYGLHLPLQLRVHAVHEVI